MPPGREWPDPVRLPTVQARPERVLRLEALVHQARQRGRDVLRSNSVREVRAVARVVLAAVPVERPVVARDVRVDRVDRVAQVAVAAEAPVAEQPVLLDAVVKRASRESPSGPSAKNLKCGRPRLSVG